VTWRHRPFPDAILLLLQGRQPALVDSGFVGHARETAAWARAHAGHVALVVNTNWPPTTSAATHCCGIASARPLHPLPPPIDD